MAYNTVYATPRDLQQHFTYSCYLLSLEHADDFLAAVNNTTIDGKYFMTLKSGPIPMPEKGFLEVRIDFRITSITID